MDDNSTNSMFCSNTKLTREERELVINYNEDDGVWVAESSIPKFWRKLEKKNWTCTNTQYYADGTVCSKTFTSNCGKGISITDPTVKREMSAEDREKARQRFLSMRKNNSGDSRIVSDIDAK